MPVRTRRVMCIEKRSSHAGLACVVLFLLVGIALPIGECAISLSSWTGIVRSEGKFMSLAHVYVESNSMRLFSSRRPIKEETSLLIEG